MAEEEYRDERRRQLGGAKSSHVGKMDTLNRLEEAAKVDDFLA